jgi:hypothetical protein
MSFDTAVVVVFLCKLRRSEGGQHGPNAKQPAAFLRVMLTVSQKTARFYQATLGTAHKKEAQRSDWR